MGIDPQSYDKSLVASDDGSVGLGVTTEISPRAKDTPNTDASSVNRKEPPKGPGGKGGRK